MVAAKDQTQRPQLSAPGLHNSEGELIAQPEHIVPSQPVEQSLQIPVKINPVIKKQSKSTHRSHRLPLETEDNLEQFSRFAKRHSINTNQVDKDSTVDTAITTGDNQQPASNSHTVNNSSQQEKPINSFSRSKVKAARHQPKMELHDASGTVLQQYPLNGEGDAQQQQQQGQQQQQQVAAQQGKQEHQVQQTEQHEGQQSQANPNQGQPQTGANTAATAGGSNVGSAAVVVTPGEQQAGASGQATVPKKPTRMPGTKQCPTCHNTIAAAVAKCPKCPHVFREKKEKVKRSGKRGKKNCPKCQYENPSACSSCKKCKYVFRLKLMDKYKAMRPRQQSNESAAAAAAAAALAAANMAHASQSAVTAVSTVPLPAGVATYPNQMGQQMHPGHAGVQVISPLPQHPIAMHQHGHNVHSTGVPMHPMPQHSMHPHQPHPQL